MRETELYEPVRDWLTDAGWTVRAEVRDCDIAAVSGDRLLLVELKTTLNFDVVLQAADRQRMGDFVYVAVPAKTKAMAGRRWQLITHVLKRLELGLLLVHFPRGGILPPRVEEAFPPVPFDRVRSRDQSRKKREALLKEFKARSGDHNRGGSSKHPLVTAYREQALAIARCLAEDGPSSPKALRGKGTDAGKTTGILYDNHYGWFESVSRGVYGLTAKGAEALAAYEPVLARAANLPDTCSGAAARAGEADSAGEAGSDGEADAAGETGSTGDEDPVGDADPVAKGTVPLAYRTEKP